MKKPDHIHSCNDDRGHRDVFVNGKLVKHVFFADTRKGVVRYYPNPLRLDKWGRRILSKTMRGKVEVRPRAATPVKASATP